LLPLSTLGGEELVDVRVDGSWLVAVTRTAAGARRSAPAGRVLALDLHERRSAVDVPLDVNARDFEILHPLVYVLSDGRVDQIPLDDPATARTVNIPDASEIAAGRDHAYVLCVHESGRSAEVVRLDSGDLSTASVHMPPLTHLAQKINVLASGGREWLYLF